MHHIESRARISCVDLANSVGSAGLANSVGSAGLANSVGSAELKVPRCLRRGKRTPSGFFPDRRFLAACRERLPSFRRIPARSLVILFVLILPGILHSSLSGQDNIMTLNEQEYFETRGFNLFAFENAYTGFFFDEKTSGIMLIHHGVRTATGGAVRLKPAPEQWDQIPIRTERIVHKEENSVEIGLRYEDFDFNSTLLVKAEENGVRIIVTLDKPIPERLEGRAGFNLEFLPSAYFEKTYQVDGTTGLFPLHPSNSMRVMRDETQLRQFAGHSTFDGHGRPEYVEPEPIARGKTMVLAPEDPATRIRIESINDNDLLLLDGRSVAQNGWFVVRTLIPSGKSGKVVEWILTPSIIPDWVRTPVIGYSQVGYHPGQEKVAVIELDRHDVPVERAAILQLNDKGGWTEKYAGKADEWGEFYRYRYLRFDFSSVKEPALYRIRYGEQESGPFQIGSQVHDQGWHPTLDVWFPVQMDHMFVNEAYRVWHGAAHLDDALQAPVNHQHFDGYRMGDSTETRYQPGERVPGLNIGGWFDAGDFDIRTGSHSATVVSLVDSWEQFGIERDETLVDQQKRFVDIHHPDGFPDILQQIEHGTLALIAQHRAFGRAIPGIIVPHLHQYHHLGDGSTQTDNLNYNPNLKPYESDGYSSGTFDDRWVFTTRMARNSYSSISALAAAGRAMKGYNDELAEECIRSAIHAWEDEQAQPVDPNPNARGRRFGRVGELQALLQLFKTTKDQKYGDAFQEVLWGSMDQMMNFIMRYAVEAVDVMGPGFRDKLIPYVEKYKESNDRLLKQNPYGVPITSGGWAGNSAVVNFAATNYLLHKAFPGIIGPEYAYRGLDYIYGCHPYSNVSFVSGVGLQSKKIAYGNNRADFSFIAGGIVPGVLILKPDFPENKDDWPFFWGENEYVIDICANYIYLVNAISELGRER